MFEEAVELLREVESSKYFDLSLGSKLRRAIEIISDYKGCDNCKFKQLTVGISKEVDIVRCRECRHWKYSDTLSRKICGKGIITFLDNKGNGYCSYGERLTNTK